MGGLSIHTSEEKPMPSIESDRRLFLDAEKKRVVEEKDPAAAFLLAGEGCEIMPEDVQRYALTSEGGRVVLPGAAKPEPKSGKKKK